MNTKHVIGKRIVAVRQRMTKTRLCGTMAIDVLYLELEDGTRLVPVTGETDFADYIHDLVVNRANLKPKKSKKK